MSIMTNKKIIAVLIIAIMIITLATPVFAATNKSASKNKLRDILKLTIEVAMDVREEVRPVIKSVAKDIFSIIRSWKIQQPDPDPDPDPEPVVVQVNFANIAKDCKAVLRKGGFTYGTRGYDFSKATPVTITENKIIDCSEYVSWVIYEYAKKKGNTDLMEDFTKKKNSTSIKNYLSSHTEYFTKIGKLSSIKTSDLKAGDIIVKSGHVEIFGKYDSSKTNYEYRCYNAGSNTALSGGANTGELTGGACNGSESSYTVYRIK